MSLGLQKPMDLAAFLEWEDRQPLRHEFDGIRAVAVTGGTAGHAAIQRNIPMALGSRLRGRPCQFYGSDLKIEAAGRIRYPDGLIVCSPVPREAKVVRDPVVIFEVLSDSTERTDLVKKNREYAATESVQRYVVLAQDEISGTMFERIAGDWVGHLLAPKTILRMPEIGIEVPLAEFYEGIDLGEAGGSTSAPSP